MKKYLLLPLALLAFASCDWTTREPRATQSEVSFDYNGGEQTVIIDIEDKNSWWFGGFMTSEYKIIDKDEVPVDTLADGRIKVDYDWADFYIAKDMSSVKVQVDKNQKHEDRSIQFIGASPMIDGASFWVKQNGNLGK